MPRCLPSRSLALVLLALGAAAPLAAVNAAENVKARYIVAFTDDADVEAVAADLGKKYGAPELLYKHALKGMAGEFSAAAVDQLKADKRVRYVEPDLILSLPKPVDGGAAKGKPGGGGTPAPAQSTPSGIRRIFSPLTSDVGGLGIAVIDTGIDPTHPDLSVVVAKSFLSRGSANDDNGHGTHVAGTIAAKANSLGVIGVVPGAPLWSIKVLDRNGSGQMSWIIAGIDYVAANSQAIGVANMSLGGAVPTSGSDPMHEAIQRATAKGVVFVVAAGNEAAPASTSRPAAYSEVITVSAIVDTDGAAGGLGLASSYGADDTLASFSNYGEAVDIAAPGVAILSTWKGGGYNTISGTSMASPHVAGTVAAYLLTHTKPADLDGVNLVREALLLNAIPQSYPEGFSEISDGTAEPLVNAGPALLPPDALSTAN